MKENIAAKLTGKDDKYACALADKIISESQETDEWYEYFDDFASLLDHPKSLVRNRALKVLIYLSTRTVCVRLSRRILKKQKTLSQF